MIGIIKDTIIIFWLIKKKLLKSFS